MKPLTPTRPRYRRQMSARPSSQAAFPESVALRIGEAGIRWRRRGGSWEPVRVIDPAIESHYGTGYERSRLFPGGRPSLEFVRSMELLDRLLPSPPAQVLDVGGGPRPTHSSSQRFSHSGHDCRIFALQSSDKTRRKIECRTPDWPGMTRGYPKVTQPSQFMNPMQSPPCDCVCWRGKHRTQPPGTWFCFATFRIRWCIWVA